jgi:hypothetical protein
VNEVTCRGDLIDPKKRQREFARISIALDDRRQPAAVPMPGGYRRLSPTRTLRIDNLQNYAANI